ncbi:MotA/TolQ/ExbB proton channel family protein [Olivibacter sp. XZL3]|uniref:MotA/TolQ/ExbB proton channel family protein n=1 Tax=Olivibacter sp. XZL3 TaxID=1735116 RepID=UPI001065EE8B|nr:MotA/TolQ/ExbB proton channel family protein [Olivibacter sp. XZL3]
MQYFDKAIFWLSSGLLVPVMVAVAYFLVKALMQVGQFYAQYMARIRFDKQLTAWLAEADEQRIDEFLQSKSEQPALWSEALGQLAKYRHSEAHRDKAITEFEISCEKELDKSRTLSKMGPILGLMGTLIPMGPALAGLASGDIAEMSHHMQVAFNTTVVGLVIGCIGYLILQTKQRWFAEDLNRLEFINDLLRKNVNNGIGGA